MAMRFGAVRSRAVVVVVALLCLGLVNASTQAKLSLYRPCNSPTCVAAKATKLVECRLAPASRIAPREPVRFITLERPAHERPHPEAEPALRPVLIDRSHFFRPPPFRT